MSKTPEDAPHSDLITDYLQHGGSRCLFCKSADITSSSYEADGDWVAFNVTCDECGATWQDIHTLTSVANLKGPEKLEHL